MEYVDYYVKHVTNHMLARLEEIRHREHVRYVKTNNPLLAYTLHILNNRHEKGNPEHTI